MDCPSECDVMDCPNKLVKECASQRNYLIVAPPKLKCSTEWIDQLMSKNWNIQESVTSWTVRTNDYTLVERLNT